MKFGTLAIIAVAMSFGTLSASAQEFPLKAGSWGGNLRSGPSIAAADVGSLPEGAPITILRRSPESFNGYDWFYIETASGQQAYQWGGVICGYGEEIPGAYRTCEIDITAVMDNVAVPLSSTPVSNATSTYTDLDFDACETLSYMEEGGSSTLRCPGYFDIPLIFLEGDGRIDIDVGVDDGEFTSLTPFNGPGGRMEWRLDASGEPFAMIYRLSIATPEVAPGSTLFIKSLPSGVRAGCLVAKVDGAVENANVVVRQIADARAKNFPCGSEEPVFIRAGQ